MKEKELDMFLQINTRGVQQGFHRSLHYHRYEPTPYAALEKLFQVYEPLSNPKWVDYGSGKGRVGFYIFAFHRIPSVGIEMDEGFFTGCTKKFGDISERAKAACSFNLLSSRIGGKLYSMPERKYILLFSSIFRSGVYASSWKNFIVG